MNCPDCGFYVQPNANFCQNCGHRFDEIPKVERIEIHVEPEEQNVVQPPVIKPPPTLAAAPVIAPTAPAKQTSTGVIVVLTVMTTLAVLGVLMLMGYYFLNVRSNNRNVVVATDNANVSNQNSTKSPPSYTEIIDKAAPPDKRAGLMDEQIEISASDHFAKSFSIKNPAGARLMGGLRVIKGKNVNLSVYTVEAYEQYPAGDLKPVLSEKTANKIINQSLKPGDYFLVFENNGESPNIVAAEFFLVTD